MRTVCFTTPLAIALSVLVVSSAAAQPEPPPADDPPADVAPEPTAAEVEADNQLQQARAALASGDIGRACELFTRADTLKPSEDTKFELAQCYERDGKLALAASSFERVASAGGARSSEAQRRAEALRSKLASPPAASPPPPSADPDPNGPLSAGGGEKPLPEPVALDKDDKKDDSSFFFSDFMDTRLTWTFGDDDVLHATGQTVPLSADASISDRPQYRLFFDNLNSRFAGRENLSHLVLYKKMPGFIERLDTEASMVLRVNLANLSANTNNVNSAFEDSGSFIRIFYRLGDKDDEKTGLGITFWPLDTDRFRLGHLYDISWGGTNARINQSIFPRIQGSSPGAKLQFDHKLVSAYFGFKTAQIVQVQEILTPGISEVEVIRVAQTNFGLLGGANVELGDYFSADLGGGYFQQGKFDLPDVLGQSVYTFGLSSRLTAHSKGSGVKKSIDLTLYRNDPMKYQQQFAAGDYEKDETTWSVAAEFTNLWQNLKDFDVPGATRLQQARAAALQGNLQTGNLRLSLTGIYRDLPYVLRNVPSFVPFNTLPGSDNATTQDEIFVAAAADYYIKEAHLTPGIGAGLQLPSTFTTDSIDAAGNTISRTVVVRQQGEVSILPVDRSSVPIFQARASLRWDISKILAAVAWIQYRRDNNGTFVERDPNEGTVALRSFVSPDFLGFGTSVQARFGAKP